MNIDLLKDAFNAGYDYRSSLMPETIAEFGENSMPNFNQWYEQFKAEQEAYKPKVEFYREQTEKLRKYIHENNIGAPCQGFFDVLYEHIQDLKAKLKQTV